MKEVGSIIIGTKVDNKGLKDDLKDTETIMKNFDDDNSISVDVDINSKIEDEFKKLYAKYEKGTFKKQFVPEETLTLDNAEASLEKMKRTYQELEQQMNDFRNITNLVPNKIEEWNNLSQETKDNIKELRKMMTELTLQMNMQNENIRNTEKEYQNLLGANQSLIEQTSEQTRNENQLIEQANQRLEIEEEINEVKSQSLTKSKIGDTISNIGNKAMSVVGSILGGVGKIALKIFGIIAGIGSFSTIIGLIAKAFQKAVMENKQLIANIKYLVFVISNALTNASSKWAGSLANGIANVINLIAKLIWYIAYLVKAWFNIDILAGSSIDAFKEAQEATEGMASGLGGAVKQAKELDKQLAGFDEMNILQDNKPSSGGSGGGAGGGIGDLPEIDPDLLFGGEIPEWLKWIADHGDLVKLILEGIATAILAIKFGLSFIQGLGLFLMIDGIVKLIKDLKDYLADKTWDNFNKVMTDIGEIILGLSLVLIPLAPHLSLILAILGQIVMTISALPKWIESVIRFIKDPSWDNYKRTLRDGIDSMGVLGKVIGWILDKLGLLQPQIKLTEEAERDLKQATEELTSAQDLYVNSVDRAEEAQRKLNEAQEKTGLSGEDLFNKVQQGVLDYKDMTAEQKEVYKAYLNNVNAQNNLKDATDKLTEAKKNEKIASLENQLAVANESKKFDEYKQAVVDAFNKGEISSEEARELIGKAMSGMSEDSKKTFTKDLPDNIKEGLDPKKYDKNANELRGGMLGVFGNLGTDIGQKLGDALGGALKTAINKALAWIESQLNRPVDAINGLIGVINAIPGVSIGKISRIKLPRLAKGGIINQPGRGVPVGGAIAGESGREGVIPLTDSQQMALLGEAIGKYVVINLTNINQMNGRLISRELKRMENESDFAYNR